MLEGPGAGPFHDSEFYPTVVVSCQEKAIVLLCVL